MGESFNNSLINNSIFHLLNFEKYSSFTVAAREAAINNNFQIVLLSEDFNTLFYVETRHKVSIEEMTRFGIQSNIVKRKKGARLDYNGISTYWTPIRIKDTKYYLMLVDNDECFQQDDIVKLAEIIELSMGMWNYSPERDTTAEFIRALRRGNRSLAYSLMQELDFSEKDCAGIFFIPGVEKEIGLKIFSAFEKKFNLRTVRSSEMEELAGVLLRSDEKPAVTETDWRVLAKEMNKAGASKTFNFIGLDGIEGMCRAFKIITETEPFIQLIFPYKHFFSKYELALAENCVGICVSGGNNKKNYLDLLRPFTTSTSPKTRQLLTTLETFVLDAGLSTSKAATLLNIHANTVQYRLKKIKDILGVDITGNTIVPGLMMALAVARIEKEIKSF